MQGGLKQLTLFELDRPVTVALDRYNTWRHTKPYAQRPPILLITDKPMSYGTVQKVHGDMCQCVFWYAGKRKIEAWIPVRFIDAKARDLDVVTKLVLDAKHRATVVVCDEDEKHHALMVAEYIRNPIVIKVSA